MTKNEYKNMNIHLENFKQFIQQREKAAKAYICGNPTPVLDLTTQVSPATFFSPRGDFQQGAEDVLSKFTQDAKNFCPGGDTHFEIFDIAADTNLAYWVGLQKANVLMHGKIDSITMNLRITEIFRRENNEWKLVHRHADFLNIP